jgi:hypothetical protein
VRGFLLPPEARGQAEAASASEIDASICTPEGLTLTSLLLVTVPVTAGLSIMFAPVVLPTTVLVAYAFWHFGRRITQVGPMIVYCFAIGGLAGAVNSWLSLLVWGLFYGGAFVRYIDGDAIGLATLFGAGVGLAYGTGYLLPMLIQVATRRLRRTEAIDRCLIGYGAWGVSVLVASICVASDYEGATGKPIDLAVAVALASISVHAALFAIGILRWARRRSWLSRVEQGKVPGWLVCEQHRFHQAQLEGLEVFCKPLFRTTHADRFKVLARSSATRTSEAYRTVPVAAKYLVV